MVDLFQREDLEANEQRDQNNAPAIALFQPPTIAFIGKSGAGKSTLINALSRDDDGNYKETASVPKPGVKESHTKDVNLYENLRWFDCKGLVNLVDVPGLDDSEGKD